MNNLYLLFALCYFIAYSKNYARYCDPVEASSDAGYTTGVVTPEPCPQGYFCLLNTETKHEHPCPAGSSVWLSVTRVMEDFTAQLQVRIRFHPAILLVKRICYPPSDILCFHYGYFYFLKNQWCICKYDWVIVHILGLMEPFAECDAGYVCSDRKSVV